MSNQRTTFGRAYSERGINDNNKGDSAGFAMYAAARTIPLALFALGGIYKQATPALLILGALAGAMQLLDAEIGLFEHDLWICAGPLFIAVGSAVI